MNDEVNDTEMSGWFSTYGFLTAQRILEGFKIHLEHDELLAAVNNSRSVYYQLLKAPLKNVFNGIVLQQVHDYQVYVQKLFIDYLLSGQNDKEEDSPGNSAREDLKEYSNKIMELSDELSVVELDQHKLIAESQSNLIKLATEIQNLIQKASDKIQQIIKTSKSNSEIISGITRSFALYKGTESDMFSSKSSFWDLFAQQLGITMETADKEKLESVLSEFNTHRKAIDELLETYLEKANQNGSHLRNLRHDFYDAILRTKEIIQNLPEYRSDQESDAENLSALNFDAKIGENSHKV